MKKPSKAAKTNAASSSHLEHAEFWMPLKMGLFVGLLFSALTYPAWHVRRVFQNPADALQIGILKTADVILLVVLPVLAGLALGYFLFRNKASLHQTLVATVMTCALMQIVLQIGENYTLAFFSIPVTVTLVSALISKNALNGFQT